MPRTVFQNTYSGGGTAQILQTKILDGFKAAIQSHSAWAIVDDFTVSTYYRYVVAKCLASASGFPSDFYVTMNTNVNSYYGVGVTVHEGYNTTTKVPSFLAAQYGVSRTLDSLGRDTNTSVAFGSSGTWSTGANNPHYTSGIYLPGFTSALCIFIVDDDNLFFAAKETSQSNSAAIAIGKMDSLTGSVADPMPLGITSVVAGNQNYVIGGNSTGYTRTPGGAGLVVPNYANLGRTWSDANWPHICEQYSEMISSYGYQGGGDKHYGGKMPVSDLLAAHPSPSATGNDRPFVIGGIRGRYRNLKVLFNPPVGITFGDIVKIDTRDYYYFPTSASASYGMLVPGA